MRHLSSRRSRTTRAQQHRHDDETHSSHAPKYPHSCSFSSCLLPGNCRGIGEETIHDLRSTTVPSRCHRTNQIRTPRGRTHRQSSLRCCWFSSPLSHAAPRTSRTFQSSTGHGHRRIGETPDRIPHPAMTNHPEPSPSGWPHPQEVLCTFPYRRWP